MEPRGRAMRSFYLGLVDEGEEARETCSSLPRLSSFLLGLSFDDATSFLLLLSGDAEVNQYEGSGVD